MLFFYGIIIKFTTWNSVLFEIKSFIPECILVAICVCLLLKNGLKFSIFNLFGIVWFILIVVLNIILIGLTSVEALYTFRDLIIPLFVAVFINSYSFQKTSLNDFMRFLIRLSVIYLISGAILGVIERIMGTEWTSSFYTGYVFYGNDDTSGVKISTVDGRIRAPGLTGNSASFAFYAVVSLLILWSDKRKNIISKLLCSACGIAIIWSTENKTAIIGLATIMLVWIFYKGISNKKYVKITVLLSAILIVLGLCGIPYFISAFPSFQERLQLWGDVIKDINIIEFIFPYRAFLYGAGGGDFTSVLDNAYLYFLLSGGILGFAWIYLFAFKMTKTAIKDYGKSFLFVSFFVFLLMSSVTTNVVQGRAFFSICFILLALFSNCKNTVLILQQETKENTNKNSTNMEIARV